MLEKAATFGWGCGYFWDSLVGASLSKPQIYVVWKAQPHSDAVRRFAGGSISGFWTHAGFSQSQNIFFKFQVKKIYGSLHKFMVYSYGFIKYRLNLGL